MEDEMSKAKDEYLEYEITNGLNPKIHRYVVELQEIITNLNREIEDFEQRIVLLVDANVARDLVIKANEQQRTELVSSLSIALDDKRRKLYLSELKETLKKHSDE